LKRRLQVKINLISSKGSNPMEGGDLIMGDKKAGKKTKPNMKGKGKAPVKTAPVKPSK
jgi:hypothetical protein